MHKTLAAIVGAAMFAFVGPANAEEAQGTVEAVDPATGTIILDDGQTYSAADGVSIEGLQPGDTVTVSFEVEGDKNMATAVTKAE